MEIRYTVSVTDALRRAAEFACDCRHEFITPEHLLHGLFNQLQFVNVLIDMHDGDGVEAYAVAQLSNIMSKMEKVPGEQKYDPELSSQFQQMLGSAAIMVGSSGAKSITVPHLVKAIFSLRHSAARDLLLTLCHKHESDFMRRLIDAYNNDLVDENPIMNGLEHVPHIETRQISSADFHPEDLTDDEQAQQSIDDYIYPIEPSVDFNAPHNKEVTQLITSLCRCENNNVLLVGDPGVGKTEILRKLAGRIANGKVPKRLRKCIVFELDICSLISGSQFRGELETRVRTIFEELHNRRNSIVCIDNIHNLMNIGQNNDGNVDMISILKPYLDNSELFIVGTTTADDFQRYLTRNKNIIRRFQRIDVSELTEEETFAVASEHCSIYEEFHNVSYSEDVLRYAITMSVKYMRSRSLPEKSLDVLDQAGAECEIKKKKEVTKETIDNVIKNFCNLDSIAEKNENQRLATLYDRLTSQIFGQNEAIKFIVEAVQMSKAGLLDENKPIASLLFVGPTGVGKTEVARTLAKELGIALQRFDMSEYAESHTIAKLIGSPAGYVGYDDGGLLTSAIQKTPQCVLLLDEIEKAHSDIYNILLQVMDYGQLTDNKGVKTSFQNVILIMTSNAGAQYAHLASLGFGNTNTKGSSMFTEVKKVFKPEFINRLSGTIVFNDMDMKMATMILDKKLRELSQKLNERKVEMTINAEAHKWLLNKSYTKDYGARETDRVISRELKPLFVKEILFGGLTQGGKASVELKDDKLILNIKQVKTTRIAPTKRLSKVKVGRVTKKAEKKM